MDQIPTTHNPRPNPYVGPRSFEKGQPIYGRDAETRALASLLSAERIVLLHAHYGAGKTSLIQAALVPAMEKRQFYVRPAARVNREPSKIPASNNYNRYIFSLLSSFESARPTGEQIPEEELAALTLADYFKRRPRPEDYSFELFILDQFEEILTLNPADQASKIAFFSQVGRALSDDTHWVLFSMREDFLGALDPYLRYIPDGLSTRYRLDLLGKKAASQALQLPADDAGVTFEDKAVERLLNDLSMVLVQRPDGEMERKPGPYIEPVQLQVVAYRLWDSLPATDSEIDNTDLDKLGDVGKALGAYYAQKVEEVALLTGAGERSIREWFGRKLITEGAIRSQVRKGKTTSEGLPNEAVAKLEDTHLIRAEKRGEWTWYELAHDRLVQPVVQDNRAWFDKNLSLLQRQAELWDDKGRAESLLLSGKELDEANVWAKNNQASLQQHEKDFLAACDQIRQREKQAHRIRRLMMAMGIGALILAIVAVIFAISAGNANNLAQQAVVVANAASTQAVSEQINAQIASTRAVEQADLAATAQVVAQNERDKAELKAKEARTSQLAAQAISSQSKQYDLSLLLSVEAFHRQDNNQTRASLLSTVESQPRLVSYLYGHTSYVYAIAASPVSPIFATSDWDGNILLWDATTHQQIGSPLLAVGSIACLAFSPDGTILASGGYDNAVTLWDVETHKQLGDPFQANGAVQTVAFSPDGKVLAAGLEKGEILLWNMETEEPMDGPKHSLQQTVNSLAFSPDGRYLASGSEDSTIVIWDTTTYAPVRDPLKGYGTNSLSFSPDGQILAAGGFDQMITLWDTNTWELLGDPIVSENDSIYVLSFMSDSSTLVVGNSDNTITLWDMSTRRMIGHPLHGHTSDVLSLAVSSDGRYLMSGDGEKHVILWDMSSKEGLGKQINTYDRFGQYLYSMALSPDGSLVAMGGPDNVSLLDSASDLPSGDPLSGHTDTVGSVAFSPDGRLLASGSLDKTIRLWDLETRHPVGEPLAGHTDEVTGLAFSPDGKILASSSLDGNIILWDVATRKPVGQPLKYNDDGVNNIVFSPDGKTLAAAMNIGPETIILWDLTGPDPVVKATSDKSFQIIRIAYSPDGKYLASGDYDKTVSLWDASTLQRIGDPLKGHTGAVRDVAFSPDSSILASVSDDKTIILWDVKTQQQVGDPLRGHNDPVDSVAFTPDGKTLVSRDTTALLILWDMDPVSWAERACKMVNRNLTQEEWQRYIGDETYLKTCPENP